MAFADERLLIVNKSGDTLAITDAHSYVIFALAPTRHEPHEVAVSPDGRTAYVTDYGSRERRGNTVTVVDVASGAVSATWDLGDNLAPMASPSAMMDGASGSQPRPARPWWSWMG